jgi:chromosome partitioning protein
LNGKDERDAYLKLKAKNHINLRGTTRRKFCMKRVIFNQKGGVGKSTIAVNLAAIAASRGKRTLLIDIDPQCNASRYLLGEASNEVTPTLADYFEQTLNFVFYPKPIASFVHPTRFENLSLIPSHPTIGELQAKLESRHKIYKLRELLNELAKEYEEIFLDTPPAYNIFSQSALIAADSCIIPFDCDDFSRQALYTLMTNVREIKADHNPGLLIEGIVVNQFQARASLPQQLVDELKAEGLPVFDSKLSSSVRIRESHSRCLPMIHLDERHKLSVEYVALYEELQVAS